MNLRPDSAALTTKPADATRARLHKLLFAALFACLFVPMPRAFAATPLDSSNWQGPAGARYWKITAPGSYYLNVPEASFSTDAEYAIWINVLTGNVTLDGMGKTITGPTLPASTTAGTHGLYGVRVNGGQDIPNVRVTNLRVTNKYFGVIFEAVVNGAMDGITATGNQYGLYFWRTSQSTVHSNIASNNLIAGITCDAWLITNSLNTIRDNVTDNNGHSGIFFWGGCTGNTVQSNRSRDNVQMGIALSTGPSSNLLTLNTTEGNSTGIWIEGSNGNTIRSNVSELNSNLGIMLKGVSSNTIESNAILRNTYAGIWLDGASANTIRSNTIANSPNWGVYHANGSGGQTIYDNYLFNVNNAGFSASGANSWNIPLTSSVSAVGGPYVGGNYWGTPGGTGFSQTAVDSNVNGIADAPYSPASGNVDQFPLHAKARSVPSSSFDADNTADLLWRNPTTSQNVIWFMNGFAASGQTIAPVVDSGWSIVGRESFDGDGKVDILWRHRDGRNAIWFMDGAVAKPSSGYIPSVSDANWVVAGVGDLDGDGYADILWRHAVNGQNAIWYMRGLALKAATMIATVADLAWRVAGVGDFDGDGRSEILWRNDSSGQNVMWWFESYSSFMAMPVAAAGSTWSVAGIGDFNRDGKADILWRNPAGQNALWFQNGSTTITAAMIPTAGPEWSVGTVADLNGDAAADIVWRKSDGTTAAWLMNGASVLSSTIIGIAPGWTLAR